MKERRKEKKKRKKNEERIKWRKFFSRLPTEMSTDFD